MVTTATSDFTHYSEACRNLSAQFDIFPHNSTSFRTIRHLSAQFDTTSNMAMVFCSFLLGLTIRKSRPLQQAHCYQERSSFAVFTLHDPYAAQPVSGRAPPSFLLLFCYLFRSCICQIDAPLLVQNHATMHVQYGS